MHHILFSKVNRLKTQYLAWAPRSGCLNHSCCIYRPHAIPDLSTRHITGCQKLADPYKASRPCEERVGDAHSLRTQKTYGENVRLTKHTRNEIALQTPAALI
jgi:hypothetical protein